MYLRRSAVVSMELGLFAVALTAACDPAARTEDTADQPIEAIQHTLPTEDDGPDGTFDPPEHPCDLLAAPSVVFTPVRWYDDFGVRVHVDHAWYEHDGKIREASCLPSRTHEGECRAWIAGYEREGQIRIATEYCDTLVEDFIYVPLEEDGCHVDTQYVQLGVSTRGCMTARLPDSPDPGPRMSE